MAASEVDRIATRLDMIDQRLADVQAGIAEMRSIYDSQSKRIDRLERCLFGNGSMGLIEKMAYIFGAGAVVLVAVDVAVQFLLGR